MAKKKVNTEDQRFFVQYGIDIKKRRVFLDEEVDEASMGWIIRSIMEMVDEDPEKPIDIYINSFGGSVYDGLALFDVLERLECPLRTFCLGSAMSMSLILFLAGDERSAFPRATFMAHSLSAGVWGNVQTMEIDLKESQRLNGILLDILADKSKKTKKWWAEKIKHDDFYINLKTSKILGIVNKVMD